MRYLSLSEPTVFASGGQNIGVSASASVLWVNIQDWFPLGWTDWISLRESQFLGSLIRSPGVLLNSSPLEAKNPSIFCGSAAIFLLGGSSRIPQDKVKMLGALVLCSPSEHVFRCTLLTLRCACVNEWRARHEASEEPCSAVPRWPHTAYGRSLSGVYTDLPMPRGSQCLLRGPTSNGQSVWTELSFLKLSGLFDHFITLWKLEY